MENFSPGKSIINIGRTVEQHHQIVPNLIGFHALTGGCDSVPMMFGIGKGKALSTQYRVVISLRMKMNWTLT